MDVNEELKFLGKFKNKIIFFWGGGGGGVGLHLGGRVSGGQGGCERRMKVFVKIQKKLGGGGSGCQVELGGLGLI